MRTLGVGVAIVAIVALPYLVIMTLLPHGPEAFS